MVEISDSDFIMMRAINRNSRLHREDMRRTQTLIDEGFHKAAELEVEVATLKAALLAEKESVILLVKDNGLISDDNKRKDAAIAVLKKALGQSEATVKKLEGKGNEASRALALKGEAAQHYYSIAYGLFCQSVVSIAALREVAPGHPIFEVEDGTSKSLVNLLPLAAYDSLVSTTGIAAGRVDALVEENKIFFAADTASAKEASDLVDKARVYGQQHGDDSQDETDAVAP